MAFEGKLALVTGAARGIGRGTAEALAAAGARVFVVDIDEGAAREVAAGISARGGQAQAARCDVSSDAEVAGLAALVMATAGAPDLLVNNAYARGVGRGGVDGIDLEAWRRAFDVNVFGYVRMHRAFVPEMAARGSGHIVDTASSLVIAPNPDVQVTLAYVATKGAILGMGYGLRYSLHANGLRYSVFCPGLTDTRPAGDARVTVHPQAAAPVSHAVAELLAGIERGDFLISSEPEFADTLLRMARAKLDPLALYGTKAG